MIDTKQYPWQLAKMRRRWVDMVTMPIRMNTALQVMFTKMMFPD
jgi:hypothetical protein